MRRMIAAAGVSASLIFAGCAEKRDYAKEQAVQTTVEPTEASQDYIDDAWIGALDDLRAKVSQAKAFKLLVAKNACVAWDNIGPGGITIIKNPVIFSKESDDQSSIAFLPFVNNEGSVMNGPFSYSEGGPSGYTTGNMGAIKIPNGAILFDEIPKTTYKAATDGDSGWLESPDGTHYAETHYVTDTTYQQTLDQLCPGQILETIDPEVEIHKD